MLDLPTQFALQPIVLPRSEMIAFAESFDPQPFHIDEATAAGTLLEGLAASAWYVCAKVSDALRADFAGRGLKVEVAGADQIILFAPIRPEDVLAPVVRQDSPRSCKCGGRGVDLAVDVTRMGGDCVARLALTFLASDDMQNGSEDAPGCAFRVGRKTRTHFRRQIDDIPFFEGIEIGDEINLGTYTFGRVEIDQFQDLTSGRSRHRFVEPYVPPWHLPAAWMQCMVRHYARTTSTSLERFPRLGPAAGFKQLRWHRDVAVGETIAFRGWAERKLIIPSQADWGLLVVGAEGVDACGSTVISFYPQMLLERAPRLAPKIGKISNGQSGRLTDDKTDRFNLTDSGTVN